jgi:hypothetical protein
VREQPGRGDFNFYLVSRVGNAWVFPALRLIGHRSALFSYAEPGLASDTLRRFIEEPDALLSH